MNRGVQLALVIMAAIALPAPSRAGDTETIAKRAALFTPRRRAEGFRSMETAYPYHVIKRGGAIAELPRALRKLDVTYTFAGKQHTVEDLLARSRTQGFWSLRMTRSSMSAISTAPTINRNLRRGRSQNRSPRHSSDSRLPMAR